MTCSSEAPLARQTAAATCAKLWLPSTPAARAENQAVLRGGQLHLQALAQPILPAADLTATTPLTATRRHFLRTAAAGRTLAPASSVPAPPDLCRDKSVLQLRPTYHTPSASLPGEQRQDACAAADVQHALASKCCSVGLYGALVGLRPHLRCPSTALGFRHKSVPRQGKRDYGYACQTGSCQQAKLSCSKRKSSVCLYGALVRLRPHLRCPSTALGFRTRLRSAVMLKASS